MTERPSHLSPERWRRLQEEEKELAEIKLRAAEETKAEIRERHVPLGARRGSA